MRVLEQRITESSEAAMSNASLVEMQQVSVFSFMLPWIALVVTYSCKLFAKVIYFISLSVCARVFFVTDHYKTKDSV